MAKELNPIRKRSGPPPGTVPVTTLSGVLKEMAATYWAMKRGELDESKACKRAYFLGQLRETIVAATIEPRLMELEERRDRARSVLPVISVSRLHS